jgi:hypothetical protein
MSVNMDSRGKLKRRKASLLIIPEQITFSLMVFFSSNTQTSKPLSANWHAV